VVEEWAVAARKGWPPKHVHGLVQSLVVVVLLHGLPLRWHAVGSASVEEEMPPEAGVGGHPQWLGAVDGRRWVGAALQRVGEETIRASR